MSFLLVPERRRSAHTTRTNELPPFRDIPTLALALHEYWPGEVCLKQSSKATFLY